MSRREFEFDHLLLALGSEPNFFEMAGVRDWAATVKSLSDAALLHNTMVALLETAALQPDDFARRQLLTFVIAGGGFAELGGELGLYAERKLAGAGSRHRQGCARRQLRRLDRHVG